MDVSKCVQIFVLVHWAICLLVLGVVVRLNGNDALLQLLILPTEHLLLVKLFLDGLDEILLHFVLTRKGSNVFGIFITIFFKSVIRSTHLSLTIIISFLLRVLRIFLSWSP